MNRIWFCAFCSVICTGCTDNTALQEAWREPENEVLGCADYYKEITDDLIFYNNVWNKQAAGDLPWQQCIVSVSRNGTKTMGWKWSWPNKGEHIYGYPQARYGHSPWDPVPKLDPRFPIPINTLEELNISFDLDVSAVGEHNVATSLWVIDRPKLGDLPQKDAIFAEIMIWSYHTEQALSPAGKEIAEVTVDGNTWSVWFDSSWRDQSGANENSWVYLTFKAQTHCLTCQFDVAALLNSFPPDLLDLSDKYIADVELGTEIVRGQGLVWVNKFDLDIRPER